MAPVRGSRTIASYLYHYIKGWKWIVLRDKNQNFKFLHPDASKMPQRNLYPSDVVNARNAATFHLKCFEPLPMRCLFALIKKILVLLKISAATINKGRYIKHVPILILRRIRILNYEITL